MFQASRSTFVLNTDAGKCFASQFQISSKGITTDTQEDNYSRERRCSVAFNIIDGWYQQDFGWSCVTISHWHWHWHWHWPWPCFTQRPTVLSVEFISDQLHCRLVLLMSKCCLLCLLRDLSTWYICYRSSAIDPCPAICASSNGVMSSGS